MAIEKRTRGARQERTTEETARFVEEPSSSKWKNDAQVRLDLIDHARAGQEDAEIGRMIACLRSLGSTRRT